MDDGFRVGELVGVDGAVDFGLLLGFQRPVLGGWISGWREKGCCRVDVAWLAGGGGLRGCWAVWRAAGFALDFKCGRWGGGEAVWGKYSGQVCFQVCVFHGGKVRELGSPILGMGSGESLSCGEAGRGGLRLLEGWWKGLSFVKITSGVLGEDADVDGVEDEECVFGFKVSFAALGMGVDIF